VGGVAELEDAADFKSATRRHVGSSPTSPTPKAPPLVTAGPSTLQGIEVIRPSRIFSLSVSYVKWMHLQYTDAKLSEWRRIQVSTFVYGQ
jgi:hypothetical protein